MTAPYAQLGSRLSPTGCRPAGGQMAWPSACSLPRTPPPPAPAESLPGSAAPSRGTIIGTRGRTSARCSGRGDAATLVAVPVGMLCSAGGASRLDKYANGAKLCTYTRLAPF